MARLQAKSLESPDEVRRHGMGRVEIFELDDLVIGRTVFEPGWHWAEHVRPIAGSDLCQYHHVGVCVQGRARVRMADGTSLDIAAGQAFEIPPGHDSWVVSDEAWVTYDFAGMRSFARPAEAGERILASILFTDIVDSTARAEQLGDRAWRELVGRLNERTQFHLDRYRGRSIKTTGDGVLAVFDGAERAVRCAAAICLEAKEMGVALRAGVHTGEVEVVAGDVRGLAVHVAARVLAFAGGSEVVVSSTTHELVAGSTLAFEDRGEHELKGISGARRLFALREQPGPPGPV